MNKSLLTAVVVIASTMLIVFSCGRKDDHSKHNGETCTHAKMTETKSTAPDMDKAVCVAHGALKNHCFICDAALRDTSRLWCKEHNRYEDRCFICHPEAQDKSRLNCSEHGLYEDECFICHPELIKKDK